MSTAYCKYCYSDHDSWEIAFWSHGSHSQGIYYTCQRCDHTSLFSEDESPDEPKSSRLSDKLKSHMEHLER